MPSRVGRQISSRLLSSHLQLRARRFHLQNDEQIVSLPPAAQLLPVDIYWNPDEGAQERCSAEDIHDLLWSGSSDPGVGEVGEAVE